MKKILPLLLGFALVVFLLNPVENAAAQGLSGADFLKMKSHYQAAYISGFWAGTMVCCEVEEMNDGKCYFRDLMKAMDGVSYHQLVEMLRKYIKDHPGQKHEEVGLLFYKCIAEAAK